MDISKNLLKLAVEFNKTGKRLYIVGGAVRNCIAGLPVDDIDICGALGLSDMRDVAVKCGFKWQVVNEKLGTALITVSDTESYEYSTWREEKYESGHTPTQVTFVDNLHVDARRRDFTINCIYCDIVSGEYIDLYNGIQDIHNKVIKTIETPEFVFSNDGLRLLRLVRFASELGFDVDKKTFKCAKEHVYMLRDISADRKLKELKLILFSDFRYGNTNNCVELFNKLDIYKYLFRSKQNIKNNKLCSVVMHTTLNIRYLSFAMLLLLNKYNFKYISPHQVEFDIHNIFGVAGLNDNTNIKNMIELYTLLQTFKYKSKIKYEYLARYVALEDKCKKVLQTFINTSKLEKTIETLRSSNMPFGVDELKLTNEDLLGVVDAKHINKIKSSLYSMCVAGKISNEKDALLDMATQLNKLIKHNKK